MKKENSRKSSENENTNLTQIVGRVVKSEIDNINTGLIIDIFDGTSIVQCHLPKRQEIQRGDIVSITMSRVNQENTVHYMKVLTKAEIQVPTHDELCSLGREFRLKHPEVDMILNNTIDTFKRRSKCISFMRNYLETQEFIEVDTPYLQSIPEIAPVADFITQQPKNYEKMHLRITNTEYMRRLLSGGFTRVFQIGKCFRDEAISYKHHPEFTQLTFGIAGHTYEDLAKLIEDMIYQTVERTIGKRKVTFGENELNMEPPWARKTVREALIEYADIDVEMYPNDNDLAKKIRDIGVELKTESQFSGFLARNALIDKLVEEFVVPKLIQPTFLIEYPYCLGGPAKEIEKRPAYKQRGELFAGTIEIANFSTPQNDYCKLKKWYDETLIQKIEAGWNDQELDEDYLYAMRLGIPICTTGGLGIDRLLMLLLEKANINDVILFPWKDPWRKKDEYN
ncbi:amino acid--tRNA ligase-related protein [Candidatus Bathycorpusculum sp.]|uniref:amino acid--tRNA ligase-related protein n=1 Tax=Candidatus Bathycorpusculum sp. TaxID=2994959 RepID=UPI0028252013|nr:hypothetical protein [Candidatus Termitimicrobium sp.]